MRTIRRGSDERCEELRSKAVDAFLRENDTVGQQQIVVLFLGQRLNRLEYGFLQFTEFFVPAEVEVINLG